MASMMLWLRQTDTFGVLGLALNACDERANGHRETTERIRELILATRDVWDASIGVEDETAHRRPTRRAFQLTQLASVLAVTEAHTTWPP